MKIIRGFKVRGFILAAALSAGLGFGSASAQANSYLVDLNSKTVIDIGTLGGNTSVSDINDAGQVAGYSGTAGDATIHAFITGPNGAGMMDLNSLVDLPGGLVLEQAIGINNSGQVVAIGTIPEPEIYALLLSGLAFVRFMARPKKKGGEAFSLR